MLKSSRHQLKMVAAILTGLLLWGGTYTLWACLKGILLADSAGWRLKQCSILSAAPRRWLFSPIMSLGSCLPNQIYKHGLSKGPVPLYKRHRVIEPVLIGVFRAAQ
jgi:hypothetical protein